MIWDYLVEYYVWYMEELQFLLIGKIWQWQEKNGASVICFTEGT